MNVELISEICISITIIPIESAFNLRFKKNQEIAESGSYDAINRHTLIRIANYARSFSRRLNLPLHRKVKKCTLGQRDKYFERNCLKYRAEKRFFVWNFAQGLENIYSIVKLIKCLLFLSQNYLL